KRAVAQWCNNVDPADVLIVPDKEPTKGRPRAVVHGTGIEPPWLSITHAGDVVGVALAPRPCGLDVQDVEAITPLVDSDLVYGDLERDLLSSLAGTTRIHTACAWWVAKEAALKATGLGLSVDLSGIPGAGTPVRVMVAGGTTTLARLVVPAPEGHLAALAAET